MLQDTQLFSMQFAHDGQTSTFDVIPRGGFDLVVVPETSSVRIKQDGSENVVSGSFVAGANVGFSSGIVHATGVILVVNLSFDVARAVLGMPLHALSGQLTPIDSIDPQLGHKLGRAGSKSGRAGERAVLHTIGRIAARTDRPEKRLVASALRRIDRMAGRERVADLAAALGVSRRTLERAFADQVGLAPKSIAGLTRAHKARSLLLSGMPLTEAALMAGYFDHAHMCREIKRISGRAPSEQAEL